MRTPLVLTVPDLSFKVAPQDLHPKAEFYFGSLVPLSIRRARRIMVSSEAIRKEVINLYHIVPEAVARVPLCVDKIFVPAEAEGIASVRKSFGLPERYLLYVGTIDSRKGLARLRAAYDLLPPDLDDTALVLVGRTNRGAEKLAEDLKRPGRRGHVMALGYVPRETLPGLYAGASIFIYPSRYEGFGLPVLEAMSCGAAVIVSNAEALKELVEEDAGVALRTDSVEELTQAIERLLRYDKERERLKAAALKRASQYSLKRLGLQTVQVYREALAA
jgi:glycosyltransferase involved in cell wall biosynthesis